MRKMIVSLVLLVSCLFSGTSYAHEQTTEHLYPVWYGDKVNLVTKSEFQTLVSDGKLYLTAFDDLVMDLGWKAVTEGKTYRVTTTGDTILYIHDDAGIRHGFYFDASVYGESYTDWFSVHYFGS